jgi:hypothetical protein
MHFVRVRCMFLERERELGVFRVPGLREGFVCTSFGCLVRRCVLYVSVFREYQFLANDSL